MKLYQKTLIGSAGLLSLLLVGTAALAQSSSSASAIDPAACTAALDAQNSAISTAIDKLSAAEKAAYLARTGALKSAVALTDLTQRQTAIKAANTAFKKAMDAAMKQYNTDMKAADKAFATACPAFNGKSRPLPPGTGKGKGGGKGQKNFNSGGHTGKKGKPGTQTGSNINYE